MVYVVYETECRLGMEQNSFFFKCHQGTYINGTHIYHCSSLDSFSCDETSIESGLSQREYFLVHVVGKQTETAHRIGKKKAGEIWDSKDRT